MIDKTVMTGMLKTYDSFQIDVAVSVLRNLDESNSKVERKVVDFITGEFTKGLWFRLQIAEFRLQIEITIVIAIDIDIAIEIEKVIFAKNFQFPKTRWATIA